MRPQAYQQPEIRDENDFIIQQGTFGKKTPFVNSQNDGILDYIINNLEAIKGEKESKTDAQIEYEKLQDSIDTKQNLLTFDTTPKYGSENPVTSDGIKKAIEAVEVGAPDLTPYMKKDADSNLGMGWYSINFQGATISSAMFNSAPMLTIKQTGRGVNVDGLLLMKGSFVATEDYVLTTIPKKVSQLTDDVGIAKINNGHLIINGSEIWVE